MRRTTIAAIVLAVACAFAAPAMAHQGDPRFDSVLTGTGIPGLKVQVLNYGDRLLLQNRTGQTVTLEGYENEPYARLLPDGTVQVNQRSPATYLNNDPYANATVPKTARREGRARVEDHRGRQPLRDPRPPDPLDEPGDGAPEGDRPGRPDQGLRLVGPGAGGRREADGHHGGAVVARQGRGGRHAGRRDRRAGRARARVDRVRRDRAPAPGARRPDARGSAEVW